MKKQWFPVPLLLASLVIGLGFSQTSQRPLRHEVRVAVVNVPVYVTDRQGNPILDLKTEDFVILENGKEQPVTHFALIRNDSPEVMDLLSQFPSARRHFFILFDLSFTSPRGLLKAREAARIFVQSQATPLDLLGVATFSVFQGLKILCPFTADREQAFLAIDTLGLTKASQRVKDPMGLFFKPYQDLIASPAEFKPEGKAGDAEIAEMLEGLTREMRRLNTETLKGYVSQFILTFQTLAQALNVISGRKNLLYFSEGFDSSVLSGPSLQKADEDLEALMNRELWKIDTELAGSSGLRTALVETLRRFVGSDCAIHTVDVGGLRGESQVDTVSGVPASTSSLRSGQDTLNLLSQETGGYAFRNTNDLGQSLDFILRATNSYYLLGYTPQKKAVPGKFVNLKVQVKRQGVQLSYRRGFQGEKLYSQYTELEKQLQLVEYLSKDLFSDEIDFRVLATAYRSSEQIAQIPVFLGVPGGQFQAGQAATKDLKLEFYGYALNSAGEYVDYFHQTLDLDLRKLRDRFNRSGLKFYDLFLVRPGDTYKVKFIIRNAATGEIGSRVEEVMIPDYAQKRLSLSAPVLLDPDDTWILTRGYDPQRPSGRKKAKGLPIAYPFILMSRMFIPAVAPEVKSSLPVQIYFRAYHLGLQAETRAPRLQVRCETVGPEGKSTALTRFELLQGPNPLPPDSHEFLFEGQLANLLPGPCRLRVTCLDLVSRESVSASVPLVLVD